MVSEDRIDAARAALDARFEPEIDRALQSSPYDIRVWPPDWRRLRTISYFYRHESLLVRDRDLDRVRRAVEGLGASQPPSDSDHEDPRSNALIDGLTRLPVRVRDGYETGHLVEDLDNVLGTGVATHEHAFTVSYGCGCPATEPEPVISPQAAGSRALVRAALWPTIGDQSNGRDVRVSVIDTGLLAGVHAWAPWLDGVRADRSDEEAPDQYHITDGRILAGPDGFADPYAGHGTFVAGVIRCVAPAADVSVQKYIGADGFILESSMIAQISDGLSDSADIISMSAGGYTRNNLPPTSFDLLWQNRLSKIGGIAFVAAAGNDATRNPFWPAAFPWCVGVGSMSRDGQQRSWFSNHGAWVDAYAPGEDIVNAYPQLPYRTLEDGAVRPTEAGIVSWSGTSFAAPIVTGLIAGRMSRTGENARQAADYLLAAGRSQFRIGVGPRLFP